MLRVLFVLILLLATSPAFAQGNGGNQSGESNGGGNSGNSQGGGNGQDNGGGNSGGNSGGNGQGNNGDNGQGNAGGQNGNGNANGQGQAFGGNAGGPNGGAGAPPSIDADSTVHYTPDHARDAVDAGHAVSLSTLLPDLQSRTAGDVIDAEMLSVRGFLIYAVKVLRPTGQVTTEYYYAQSGNFIESAP